jgi:hypothetical protein
MRNTITISFGFSLMVGALFITGCVGTTRTKRISVPEMNRAKRGPQAVELFRRARFSELAKAHGEGEKNWVQDLRPNWVSEKEDMADWNARVAYRRGDALTVAKNLENLNARNQSHRLLTALLDNVDVNSPLRASSLSDGIIALPLDREALAVGFPVVNMQMMGRNFRMLWDTGATENVLRPELVSELDLVKTEVQFTVMRQRAGYVVRFATTGTEEMALGQWKNNNMPWLVTDMGAMDEIFGQGKQRIDGFLSPQLLLRDGCFTVDRKNRKLLVGFNANNCRQMMAAAQSRAPVFTWNGEVYTSARVNYSPELAVQIETGSPVTFLRSDASRYLPRGAINGANQTEEASEEIAHELARQVPFIVAGREVAMTTIDLGASRTNNGHDDIGTLGNDLLLRGNGVVVSFATMEMGILSSTDAVAVAQ